VPRRAARRASDERPLDAGTGRVCASFAVGTAAWLSIGGCHPSCGFVELSDLPQFDEAERGNPAATRRRRELMLEPRYACVAVELDGRAPRLRASTADPARPRWSADGITVAVDGDPDGDALRQLWSIQASPRRRPSVVVSSGGRVDRPALAEITEVDPPLPTGAVTDATVVGNELILAAPLLPAAARIAITGCRVAWHAAPDGHVAELTWPDGAQELAFEIEVALAASLPDRTHSGTRRHALPASHPIVDDLDWLTARAVTYVRACTTLQVAPDERVILTDHRILPLSWTRDAYWQALLLLAADGAGDRDRVADHLRWLWRRCDRPDGRWVRSHHADGHRKDLAFQADQQLYPIVELADFWRATGGLPDGVRWTDAVATAWSAAAGEIDPETGLIGTAENAADDPAAAPFIGGSQILLWYCAMRLAELADAGAVAIDVDSIRSVASRARDAFDMHLGAEVGWAYAADGRGLRIVYHDANDLPIALAPVWEFCRHDDPGWRATMAFAFSPANRGFVEGDRPGLGSTHTPGPWTLGDLQAWIAALVIGDDATAAAALDRLAEVAYADGMLPEAYAASGPVERVRHSFAWPGAALAALRLLAADQRREGLRRLRASR
jgi:hypothetical protein